MSIQEHRLGIQYKHYVDMTLSILWLIKSFRKTSILTWNRYIRDKATVLSSYLFRFIIFLEFHINFLLVCQIGRFYICRRLFLLQFIVPVVPLFYCCNWCVPSILVCNPDLFSLNRCMTYEQPYTTVAFIYDIILLISSLFLITTF